MATRHAAVSRGRYKFDADREQVRGAAVLHCSAPLRNVLSAYSYRW